MLLSCSMVFRCGIVVGIAVDVVVGIVDVVIVVVYLCGLCCC